MRIIGLTGPAGCGKDTVARILTEHDMAFQVAFGDAIRSTAMAMFNLDYQQMNLRDLKEEVIPEWGMSPRQIMQLIGTECGRQVFGEDVWIKRLAVRIKSLPPTQFVVVSDVRTETEAAWVRDQGGVVVHITRESAEPVRAHSTEDGVEFVAGDMALDNSGNNVKELERSVLNNKMHWLKQCRAA